MSEGFLALNFFYMAHQIMNPMSTNQTMINEHANFQDLETTYQLCLCKGPLASSILEKLLQIPSSIKHAPSFEHYLFISPLPHKPLAFKFFNAH
jgi:hypothetical protein